MAELAAHRARVDPAGIMNPSKLADRAVLDHVFTPSFNLLELEAKILQYDQLHNLADKISKCVRCGKCKPSCCVFFPGESLFYHPRNKNLAIGSLIEALLYEAQRFRTTDFESLAYLEDVADHCTICHKCLAPCPVKIDTGEVSILEREILVARGTKQTALPTRLTLAYLDSTSRAFNAVFRLLVLRLGTAGAAAGRAHGARRSGRPGKLAGPLAALAPALAGGARRPRSPCTARCPGVHRSQALVIEPEAAAERTVFYFPGCGSERLHSEVGKASIYLLLRAGCRVVLPPPLLCCGFPERGQRQDAHARPQGAFRHHRVQPDPRHAEPPRLRRRGGELRHLPRGPARHGHARDLRLPAGRRRRAGLAARRLAAERGAPPLPSALPRLARRPRAGIARRAPASRSRACRIAVPRRAPWP